MVNISKIQTIDASGFASFPTVDQRDRPLIGVSRCLVVCEDNVGQKSR